jgi:hypothetical protein
MCLLHHINKLIEVNLSVSILIDFLYCLLNTILWHDVAHLISGKQGNYFFAVNLSTLIFIKHVKCLSKVRLVLINVRTNCGRDKLSVVDIT